jgi:DTW domain-containing protein YfiP
VENSSRVLLILSEETLARARVLAGKATILFKLPVSLQVVLRALIEEGLKPQHQPALLATIEAHAQAVRQARRLARGRTSKPARRRRG